MRASLFLSIADALKALGSGWIDGETVVEDASGLSSFNDLQADLKNGSPGPVPLRRLRVCPKSSSSQTKLSEHEANRGEAEKSECVSGEIFKILGQAATAIEPSEGAFDDPPPW